MKIGPLKYSRKEERIFFKSFLLGLLGGLPLGIVLNYLLVFPRLSRQLPTDFGSWFQFFFMVLMGPASLCFLFTTLFYFFFSRKAGPADSRDDVLRIVWAVFVFYPVLVTYVIFATSVIFNWVFQATPWLSPIRQYGLGALLLLPFLGVFAFVFLPETPARKGLHRLGLILKGKASVPRPKARSIIVGILIFLWLLLVFLPLPNILPINLTLITGGILVAAYLARRKYHTRRK